jgi:hypothetical protein
LSANSGRISHAQIDAYLPTPAEKKDLVDLVNKIVEIHYHTDNVSNPPTDAELDAAFGAPATVGSGFVAILNDAGAGAHVYLVASTGIAWHTIELVLAI